MMPFKDAEALVATVKWYHRFELIPGLITPGASDINGSSALDGLCVPADLSGLTAADIGAWDGPITFELERRGANAIAVDVQHPDHVGFNVAKRVLGSYAKHYQMSVYDMPNENVRDLDIVIFRGVFYHLKYPLLAFEKINAAMKIGATLYFEGEAFLHYAEDEAGNPVRDMEQFASLPVPLCLSYPNMYKGANNWFIPNIACMRSWLKTGGFEPISIQTYSENGAQRLYGSARKITDQLLFEHHVM